MESVEFPPFRGFVTGHNSGRSDLEQQQIMKMPDDDTLSLFIDKYCRDHPLNPFTAAAFQLVKELGGKH